MLVPAPEPVDFFVELHDKINRETIRSRGINGFLMVSVLGKVQFYIIQDNKKNRNSVTVFYR